MTNDEDVEILGEADQIVESERAETQTHVLGLPEVLHEMGMYYRENPMQAVRSQGFIKPLHAYLATQLEARLTKFAVEKRKIRVIYGNKQKSSKEATILGSTKPKDVDVAVIDPENGPLVIIGLRSQMSSISKNVLNYYEGIVGECISLQERFPMSVHGYVYLHPLAAIKEGRESEHIDHLRYARMYAAVTGRAGPTYKTQRGIFDQFAYVVVDFEQSPPTLKDYNKIEKEGGTVDLSIETFVDRIVSTFNSRTLFWDIFA